VANLCASRIVSNGEDVVEVRYDRCATMSLDWLSRKPLFICTAHIISFRSLYPRCDLCQYAAIYNIQWYFISLVYRLLPSNQCPFFYSPSFYFLILGFPIMPSRTFPARRATSRPSGKLRVHDAWGYADLEPGTRSQLYPGDAIAWESSRPRENRARVGRR
jgi:hypothetical protein